MGTLLNFSLSLVDGALVVRVRAAFTRPSLSLSTSLFHYIAIERSP